MKAYFHADIPVTFDHLPRQQTDQQKHNSHFTAYQCTSAVHVKREKYLAVYNYVYEHKCHLCGVAGNFV